MAALRLARVTVSTSQRFLALGNTTSRFRRAGRIALSYRVLPCRNATYGCLSQIVIESGLPHDADTGDEMEGWKNGGMEEWRNGRMEGGREVSAVFHPSPRASTGRDFA